MFTITELGLSGEPARCVATTNVRNRPDYVGQVPREFEIPQACEMPKDLCPTLALVVPIAAVCPYPLILADWRIRLPCPRQVLFS